MSIAVSMPHTENGITVNFPDTNYFQFENCQSYISIKGKGVKEMDFGWYEQQTKTMWLIELKAFYDSTNEKHITTDISNRNILESKINELCQKAIHSISMLYSTRGGVTATCASKKLVKSDKLKLVFLLEVDPKYTQYLTFVNDKAREILRPLIAIFDIDSIVVVNSEIGKNSGLSWIN